MTRHGTPGHPATTPGFAIYITVDFAHTNHTTPAAYLEGRRATIDAMLELVRLCEARGWELRQPGVGGRDSQHKTMYVVEGDLDDGPSVVPAVASAVGEAAVMRAHATFPATTPQQADFRAMCRAVGVLPL